MSARAAPSPIIANRQGNEFNLLSASANSRYEGRLSLDRIIAVVMSAGTVALPATWANLLDMGSVFAAERTMFSGGQELFHQGDHADMAYIIIDGSADVCVNTPGGEISVAQLAKNDIVGEIGVLCDVPRTATLRAIDNVMPLAISKHLFF